MPYNVRKRGKRWCVYKEGASKSLGCHDSKEEAQRQQRALYAGEKSAVQVALSAQGGSVNAMPQLNGNPMQIWFSTWDFNSTSPYYYTDTGNGWNATNPPWGGYMVDTMEFDVTTFQPEAEETERAEWEGVLAVVGHPTSDRRYLIPGEIGQRDLPLPFLVQTETAEGHLGAEVAGRIEKITYVPIDEFDRKDDFNLHDCTEGSLVVFAEGTLDGSSAAEDAQRLIDNGAGVSVDLPPDRVALFDPDTLEEVDQEEITFEDLVFGDFLTGIGGKIAAATIVTIPAFEEASVMMVDKHALVASAYGLRMKGPGALTASAAGLAPLKPPAEWFDLEEPDEATPLTITEDGMVYGHLALWNQCHPAFASCERPPRSSSDYSYFHVGQIETEEGELVNVGRITVGEAGRAKGGHASLVLGRQGAMEHYDKTGCVGAFVCARDGRHGIWMSGAVRSDAPAERIRDMRANPPSGDWRDHELVAVLSVPVPGFPIPRVAEARLVASANGDEDVAVLIATAHTSPVIEVSDEGPDQLVGWTFPCEQEPIDIPTYRRRMHELGQRARAALKEANR